MRERRITISTPLGLTYEPRPIPIRITSSTFQVGSTIAGRYRLTSLLGEGGMSCVYSAIEIETGREVAIKALTTTKSTTSNLRRIRREAEAAAALEHAHVCNVSYLGVDRGTPFIVMERLVGETLRDRLHGSGALSLVDALTIAVQVLDGLAATHAAGILHRDIKPGNVFLTSMRGAPPFTKIIDFGLARLLPVYGAGENPADLITAADVIPGTPHYLTPEQLAGERDLDQRVDVWAVSLTLHEMLVGQRAYDGVTYIDIARRIILETPPPPSLYRCDVPPELDAVIARGVAKNRHDRWPSAAAMRDALLDVFARHRIDPNARRFRPEALTLVDGEATCQPRSEASSVSLEIPIEYESSDSRLR